MSATTTVTTGQPIQTLSAVPGEEPKKTIFVSGMHKESNPPEIQVQARTKDGRPLRMRTEPKFDNLEDERLYRKQHLAAACRVFADRGFDEGVAGHISVRDPILTNHFCKGSHYLSYSPLLTMDS